MGMAQEVVFRTGQVILIDYGSGDRQPAHVVRVNSQQVCWADGPRGREHWESAVSFMRRNPVVVGRVKRSFWKGVEYDYDRRYEAEESRQAVAKLVSERRAALEACAKAEQRSVELDGVVNALVKSAKRDEENRRWLIDDDVLAANDLRALARQRLLK